VKRVTEKTPSGVTANGVRPNGGRAFLAEVVARYHGLFHVPVGLVEPFWVEPEAPPELSVGP
jgi:hypothetical protein